MASSNPPMPTLVPRLWRTTLQHLVQCSQFSILHSSSTVFNLVQPRYKVKDKTRAWPVVSSHTTNLEVCTQACADWSLLISSLINYCSCRHPHCRFFLLFSFPCKMGLRDGNPGRNYRSNRRRHHLRSTLGQYPWTSLARDFCYSWICRSDFDHFRRWVKIFILPGCLASWLLGHWCHPF